MFRSRFARVSSRANWLPKTTSVTGFFVCDESQRIEDDSGHWTERAFAGADLRAVPSEVYSATA